jgi:hypothetical protein
MTKRFFLAVNRRGVLRPVPDKRRSVAQKRGPSHLPRLERYTGAGLIAPWRSNIARLH